MINLNPFKHIISILKIYGLAAIIFFVFRLILFVLQYNKIDSTVTFVDIILAFVMGLRFDVVISGYILLLPFVILTISQFFDKPIFLIQKSLFYIVFIIFSVAFMVSSADIPYFQQFFTRFNVQAFAWMDNPTFVFKMIIEEPSYWLFIVLFIFLEVVFYKLLYKIWKPLFYKQNESLKWYFHFLLSIIFLGVMIIATRGRIQEKSPIRIGTAYFSNNAFINQLGLNPNFTFIRSYLDSQKEENKSIQLMNEKDAIIYTQKMLGIKSPNPDFPLYRPIYKDSNESKNYNIVIVIMESMSANKMTRHGNPKNLTPFLDKIANEGLYFENIYTAGIHTYNGIFSTLFSFPGIFHQHPMKESSIKKYNGIAYTLKNLGYSTTYFTTHDGQFDNVEGFLKANDFGQIITQSDYPIEKVETTLGVPDDYLFEYAIPVLNKKATLKKPFFAAIMTASDHGPYFIPEYFKPKNKEEKDAIVEYADWSIQKFITMASKQSWFNNTLFVFVADHGNSMDASYKMPLSYNHSPLIFYAPGIITSPKTFDCIGGQIDIFPTIMGILNQSYNNNTLGIDLLRERRPYIYFNGDDRYGVIDKEWFLIVEKEGGRSLYKYQNKKTLDYSFEYKTIADSMQQYGAANLQTFQYLLNKGNLFYGGK